MPCAAGCKGSSTSAQMARHAQALDVPLNLLDLPWPAFYSIMAQLGTAGKLLLFKCGYRCTAGAGSALWLQPDPS
jgi:hypothetical protein